MNLKIFDPSQDDKLGQYRGGGRIIHMLKDNLGDEAEFIGDLENVKEDDTLLIPIWYPFNKPQLNRRITNNQYIIVFDLIPLKFPQHFPLGMHAKLNFWQNKHALKSYDGIITISEHAKKDIFSMLKIPEDKVYVVYPTYSNMFEMTKSGAQNTKHILNSNHNKNTEYWILNTEFCVYVGDVNWNKNIVNLAKAVKLADINAVFVGKAFDPVQPAKQSGTSLTSSTSFDHPWQEEFKTFIEEVDGDDRFIFPGYVSDKKLAQLYQNAVCNVLISRDEGFGLSYVEAATQKCPSVLSDTDIFREIAGNPITETALFAQPEDPIDIADQIKKFMEDEMFRSKMGSNAYKRSERYSPSHFKKSLLSII